MSQQASQWQTLATISYGSMPQSKILTPLSWQNLVFLFSLVDLLYDTFWCCWVWTISGAWEGISVLSYPWMMSGITSLSINGFVSWTMISTKSYLLSIISYSLKTTLLIFPSSTNSTFLINLVFLSQRRIL